MPPISSIQNIAKYAETIKAPVEAGKPGEFQAVLDRTISTMEGPRNEASQAVERFLNGEGEELHSVILATQRAELQLELGLQVRNKIIQAYQEVMRMQL